MRLSASQRSSSLFSMVYYLCSGIFCAPCKHTYTSEFAASCRAPHRLSIKEAARLYQIPNPSIISLSLLYLFFFFERCSKLKLPYPLKNMKSCTVWKANTTEGTGEGVIIGKLNCIVLNLILFSSSLKALNVPIPFLTDLYILCLSSPPMQWWPCLLCLPLLMPIGLTFYSKALALFPKSFHASFLLQFSHPLSTTEKGKRWFLHL